jgi:hypothetical protein
MFINKNIGCIYISGAVPIISNSIPNLIVGVMVNRFDYFTKHDVSLIPSLDAGSQVYGSVRETFIVLRSNLYSRASQEKSKLYKVGHR